MWYNSAMSEMITFDSGLRLIVTPNPAVRSASVGVFVKAGSVYERPEQGGISHLLEHMLFKGTKKRTAFDIANEIDSLGAQINAYTAKSSTCYHTLSRDVHAAECMEVLADMYFDATFLSDEFAKERKVVLEELAESEDTPDDLCLEKLSSAFFKGHASAEHTRHGGDSQGDAPRGSHRLSRQPLCVWRHRHFGCGQCHG